jgi:glycosyltransferase involved in cell wall biosynthesis
MFRNAQITVVVPAYNESRHIEATLRAMPSFVDHILVIDDGSRDDTAARAANIDDARIRVLRHRHNSGVGAALRTGYERAFAAGADVAVVMAGDGQMDPADLPALLLPVVSDEADYAKGNRLAHPEVVQRMPLPRLLGNRVLSFLTRRATGLSIHDSQCGYTALHRRIGERLPWHALWHGYGYPNDLLGMLQLRGARVRDIVVSPIYADEQSGVRLRHALLIVPYVLLRVLAQRALAQASASVRGLRAAEQPFGTLPNTTASRVEPRLIEADEHEIQPNA